MSDEMGDERKIILRLENMDFKNGNANFRVHYSGDLTFEEVKAVLTEALSNVAEEFARLEFIKEFEGEARLDMPIVGLLKGKP